MWQSSHFYFRRVRVPAPCALALWNLSHYRDDMSNAHTLLAEMESAAAEFGISISTLGRIVKQGGQFHERLREGKRMWPETAAKVRLAIIDERKRRNSKGRAV